MMQDDTLPGLDEAFAHATSFKRTRRDHNDRRDPAGNQETLAPDAGAPWWHVADGPWLPAFFAVQFLWGAVLFIPGTQAIRPIVRALPYLASLAFLAACFPRQSSWPRPAGSAWLAGVLALLAVNLLHPATQVTAGIAQCLFQLSIVAPVFWAFKTIRSPRQLEQLLMLAFAMNLVSALLGVLQVYFPDVFLPPQFNSLGVQLNSYYVESLSYFGPDGRIIVRPPGLSDQPGGAAMAGAFAALLGLWLVLEARQAVAKAASLGAVGVGLAAIYLTQVRSVLLMVIGGVVLMAALAFRQGRRSASLAIGVGGGTVVVAAFLWATSLGGDSLAERFLNIHEQGAFQTYQEYRGGFLSYTVNELLDRYPLGAGLGRWGMMNTYFGNPTAFRSSPIHAEIQLTGWLLDGGWPMWVLYGGALVASMASGLRLMGHAEPERRSVVLIVVTLQVFIIGLAMAGPVFNTQLGILFWTMAGGLHGATRLETSAPTEAAA